MNRFMRRNVTSGGKACLLGMLLSLIGLVYLETPLVFLFCALLGLLVAGAIASFILRPRLDVNVIAPSSIKCGEAARLEVYLRNPTWRPTYDLTVGLVRLPPTFEVLDDLQPYVSEVRQKQTTRVSLQFRSNRRGVYAWPRVQVTSAFPFNLFRFRQSQRIDGELIVLPAYHPLQSFDLARMMRSLVGMHDSVTGRIGSSEQYFGNREYQPGTPARRFDYCSWARLGLPVVREYQDTQHYATEIFVDTFDSGEPGFARRFEAILSLAMSMTDEITRQQGFVSNMMLGCERFVNDSENPAERLDALALQLALVTPAPRHRVDELVSGQPHLTDANLLFALFNGWTETSRDLYAWLLEAGCAVKPIIVATESELAVAYLPAEATVVDVEHIESGGVEID